MQTILVINGPNLNNLGRRDTEIYGDTKLEQICRMVDARAKQLNLKVVFHQSNHEGELVDFIQKQGPAAHGIAINAGAFTHTSVALLDALLDCGLPYVEVHLSNIYGRDEFRRHSLLAADAVGQICGLGPDGYLYALESLAKRIADV